MKHFLSWQSIGREVWHSLLFAFCTIKTCTDIRFLCSCCYHKVSKCSTEGFAYFHVNMTLYYLMDKAWGITVVWHPAILPCFLPLADLGGKGEHVCLWNREQPVFAFSRAGWSLSWHPPPTPSKVHQSLCNSWPLLCEKFFFSHSFSTHTNTRNSSTLSVWYCCAGFYSVSDNNLPGFFPPCCSCHILVGHLSLWSVSAHISCTQNRQWWIIGAHEERDIISGGSIFSCQWVHQRAIQYESLPQIVFASSNIFFLISGIFEQIPTWFLSAAEGYLCNYIILRVPLIQYTEFSCMVRGLS